MEPQSPQALGSCPGQLLWGPFGCSEPPGPEDSDANSSVHTKNPTTVTQNPPFVAQSPVRPKPTGVGHVSSPGSDFQLRQVCGDGPVLPCHHPLVGKDRTEPCLPRGAGLGELSCRPQGGAGGGRNAEKVWRNAPGCASRRDGGRTSAQLTQAAPQRVAGQTGTPILPSVSPKWGPLLSVLKMGIHKTLCPLIPLAVFSQIPKER